MDENCIVRWRIFKVVIMESSVEVNNEKDVNL